MSPNPKEHYLVSITITLWLHRRISSIVETTYINISPNNKKAIHPSEYYLRMREKEILRFRVVCHAADISTKISAIIYVEALVRRAEMS